MMHYGAESAKRTLGMSNNATTAALDRGVLRRKERLDKTKVKLATSKKNPTTGKAQWTGVKKALKDSQPSPQYLTTMSI